MPTFTNYDDWEKTLRPCDLLLFDAINPIGSCIQWFESRHIGKKAKWIHVGVVCPHNFIDFKNKDVRETYILESLISGFDGIQNVETNAFHNGLQIRSLREIVESQLDGGGTITCFHLKKELFQYTLAQERSLKPAERHAYVSMNESSDVLGAFWENYRSTRYDFCNCSTSVNVFIPFISGGQSKKRLFCSEAVIRLYQYLGIVDKQIDAEKISPEELGRWCCDVLSESPFTVSPDVMTNSQLR